MRWGKNIYCDRCIRKYDWYERSVAKAESEYSPMEDNCRGVVLTAQFSRKRVLDDQTRLQQSPQSSFITSVPPGLSSSNSTLSAAGSSNSLNTPGMQEELDALKGFCEGLTSRISVLEEKLLGSLTTRVTNLETITSRALTDRINDINRKIQGRVDVVEDRLSLLETRLLQVPSDQEDADMGADWDAVEVPELATDGCVKQEDNHH